MKKSITHDQIYNVIAKELKENRNEGLWLECEIKCNSNTPETKALYTKIRYEQLKEKYSYHDLKPVKIERKKIKIIENYWWVLLLVFLMGLGFITQ